MFKFSNVGIILGVVTTISILFIFLFHFFVVQKNKKIYKIFHSYYYFLVLSLFCLIYFIAARWWTDISEFINYIKNNEYNSSFNLYTHSTKYSKAFLLDLCPAVALVLPLSVIIDPTKSISKCIAPYAIIGSILTIYSTCLMESPQSVSIIEFIFLGEHPNEIFFMMHFLSLLLAIGIMLTSKNYTFWSILGTLVFIGLYIAYVQCFVSFANVKYNTTGLSQYDWYGPNYDTTFSEYGMVYEILKIDTPFIQILCYSFAVIIQMCLQFIKNWTTKNIDKKTNINSMWYSRCKKINELLIKDNDSNKRKKIKITLNKFINKINIFIYFNLNNFYKIDNFIYKKIFKKNSFKE